MDWSICTVVVLPLVPVTASHGAGASGSRRRHASSTSPHTGIPRSVAWASSGAVGFQPGEVTTRSTSSGSTAVAPGSSRTVAPSVSSSSAFSAFSSLVDSSSAVTCAPRNRRLSAAAKPETPNPATTTRAPDQSLARPRSSTRTPPGACSPNAGDPLGVEDAEAGGDGEAGDDPEADDDGHLLPAEHLEVVVQGRHPEDPVTGLDLEDAPEQPARPADLEDRHLDHHRQRDDDEQPADDQQQQLGAGHDREAGHRAALRRRGVPPEEPEAGAGEGGGDDGEVQRVTHLVALRARLEGAGLAVLPDVDQRVGREDEDARAGREAVETVGQVHRV